MRLIVAAGFIYDKLGRQMRVFRVVLFKFIRKQYLAQTVVVAVFAVCLLAAQLATVDHDADHPFHKHTSLCDAFVNFDHCKNALISASLLNAGIETVSVFYLFSVSSPLKTASSPIRIRGPPAFLA